MTIFTNTNDIQDRIINLVCDFEYTLPDGIVSVVDFESIEDVRTLLENDGVDNSDVEELITLMEYKEEVGAINNGWNGGINLIPIDSRQKYFKEMLEDDGIGPFPQYLVVDWDQTIEKLLVDYKVLSLLGESYYVRVV